MPCAVRRLLGAGFGQATGTDEVIGQLLLARIIEPTSKLDILVKPVHVIVPTFS